MKVWWVLSVTLITLMLMLLVLAWTRSMPFASQAASVVLLALWTIALIYLVFRDR
jgi:hypothetical protein